MDNLLLQLADDLRALRQRVANLERQERPVFVGARAYTAAGQTITNNAAAEAVNYDSVTYDPLNLITIGAGWTFTCPVPGQYLVWACVLFTNNAGWAAGERGLIQLWHNGAAHANLCRQDNSTSTAQYMWLAGMDVIECAAGDTLQIRVAQNSGANHALFAGDSISNRVSIARL